MVRTPSLGDRCTYNSTDNNVGSKSVADNIRERNRDG